MVWTLCRQLSPHVSFERPVLSQLLRAGTSVGANICEAQYAESRKDFVHKLKIAEKELAELTYWLDIITTRPRLATSDDLALIVDKTVNVRRMLAAAIRTAKER
ncbi:MAG: four helix bundle protein [Candidatus Kapaibacterium sp.]